MKKILITVICLYAAFSSQAKMTLEWQKDLSVYLGTSWNGGVPVSDMKQYSDDSIAILGGEMDLKLVAYSSDGTLKISTDALDYHSFTGNSSDPDLIMLKSYMNGELITDLVIYESLESGWSTNQISNAGCLTSTAGINPNTLFVVEGKYLKKYSLKSAVNQLDGQVASGINGENFIIHWESKVGSFYQIESSINLTNWVDVGTLISGTGDYMSWANALSNSPSFFRVIEK